MRSKRQRKQKERNSLKRKRNNISTDAPRQISSHPELDTNAEIVARSSLPKEEPRNAESQKMSKSEQRKQKQIAKHKAMKAQREEVYATMRESALPDLEFALLRNSASLGQRETKRQRVARELILQRAGKTLPEKSQLLRHRPVPTGAFQAETGNPFRKEDEPALVGTGSSDSESDSQDGAEQLQREDTKESPRQVPADLTGLRQSLDKARREFGLPAPSSTMLKPQASRSERSGRQRLVKIERPEEVVLSRSELPIIGMEQEVVEAILEHDIVVLSGETGCGKTTQVPQFLFEVGYGCMAYPDRCGAIGVTQPRRVAAIASAQRVAVEMGCRVGGVVGYQVRYDKSLGGETAVKFMTDGILLREAQSDFLLRKYSCLIIDEAHERSLNTDLLIGMLSRIVPMRRKMAASGDGLPLKLIIMSATLRTEDFIGNRRLFPQPPPLVHVPARQYPVTVHFSRQTELYDYAGVACAKVSQIHKQLPPGGILVFLTGQREVDSLCKRLKTSLNKQQPTSDVAVPTSHTESREENQEGEGLEDGFGEDAVEAAAEADVFSREAAKSVDDYDNDYLSEEEETMQLGGEGFSAEQLAEAEKRFQEKIGVPAESKTDGAKVHVLPLYAALPRAAQDKVFAAVPDDHRLIVVATNVAETSLTIPGIRYVVDAGRSKQKLLEAGSGTAKFEVGWISKASAEQRAGRAGRTGPGHCYRLFSSAMYNDHFAPHTPPEIVNTSLEGVVLLMKAMHIDQVHNFPYPTPPKASGLQDAVTCLTALGALEIDTGSLTALGKQMAGFPVTPRHARLILQACHDTKVAEDTKRRQSVMPLAVLLAAATSVESPFIHLDSIQAKDAEAAGRERQSARAAHARLCSNSSDGLSALNALIAFQAAPNPSAFCQSHKLHSRNLVEMAALHTQLKRIITKKFDGVDLEGRPPVMPIPTSLSMPLKKALAAGWADQVARRIRSAEHVASKTDQADRKMRAVRYQCCCLDETVYLHPQSALHRAAPEFVIYTQLIRSTKRPYMTGVTEIDAHWLADIAEPLCKISPPLTNPSPGYVAQKDVVLGWQEVTFGRHSWQLPNKRVKHPDPAVRARAFAEALLDGSVLPCMAALRPHIVALPSMVSKPEAQGLARVGSLVSALRKSEIDSKAGLRTAWKRNPNLLNRELAAWLKKGQVSKLQALWLQMQAESREK